MLTTTPAATVLSNLRTRLREGQTTALAEANAALATSNRNAGRNVYLAQAADWTRAEARRLHPACLDAQPDLPPLWGVPVSLKDCFDLAGFPTSCGSAYYREHNGIAATDSAVASRLRAAGAVITGKTHMQQVAFGITGQNRDFGDCVQPADATHLTGGSSSGAAASVQEGSAIAAIGTDTGGSIRVPAALCGLAGYRSSITLQRGLWQGGYHLAPSFDTVGWLYRDLADGPTLGRALLHLPEATPEPLRGLRLGWPNESFLADCDRDVAHALKNLAQSLTDRGVVLERFDATPWADAVALYFHLQAAEAAFEHRGHFHHCEPEIEERLVWGATLSRHDLDALEHLRNIFCAQTAELFQRFHYLLLPCAPMSALLSGEDHTQTRKRILRYTAPISLCGLPVVAVPATAGGMQLVAPLGADAQLLATSTQFAALGDRVVF